MIVGAPQSSFHLPPADSSVLPGRRNGFAPGNWPIPAPAPGKGRPGLDHRPLLLDTEVVKDLSAAGRAPTIADERIEFRVYEESNQVYVRVVNKNTGEVVKEIPSTELLRAQAGRRAAITALLERIARDGV